MQHRDQHREAITKSLRVLTEVSCGVFDDKVKEMGRVKVANGRVTVDLDYLPGMMDVAATGDFMVDSIAVAIRACYEAKPEAFNRVLGDARS